MNEEYWVQVEEAYNRVVDLPPNARTTLLDEVYKARPDIRKEVESLLEHQDAARLLTQSKVLMTAADMFGEDEGGLIGRVIDNKYQIREFLGAGGMAEVYLADHIALEMPFALKRPRPVLRGDPDFRRRFLEEARRAVILKHDNVTRVHDVIEAEKDMFVVMEYVEGVTLAQKMDDLARPFTIDEFLPLALQCSLGLAAAHEKRIVHLDVKPSNIMLTPAGQVKICDFGIARRLTSDNADATTVISTARWTIAGTPAYMAPEVILGTEFNERADLFSLGTVFYEMLTGKNPFRAETAMATTAQVVSLEVPPLSSTSRGFDPRLERIITRLMTKDPGQRYENATNLVEDLKALRRSRNRFRDIARNVREALAESWKLKVAAAVAILCLIATPPMFIYGDRVGEWLGLPQFQNNTVVVFGFHVEGGGISQPYADGLADVLAGRLSKLPQITVVSMLEVLESGIKQPSDAFRRLSAKRAVTGRINQEGDHAQIVLSLVDGATGIIIDQQTFTSRFDSLKVQNRIIEATVALLKLELTPAQQLELLAQATESPSVYSLYLEGKGLLSKRNPEDTDAAIGLFQKALAQNSGFSPALAGLGIAYRGKVEQAARDKRIVDEALTACNEAVSHDRNLAAGRVCLGAVYQLRGEYEKAAQEFIQARELHPTNEEVYEIYEGLGRAYEGMNELDKAESLYKEAIQAKPGYWNSYMWLAGFYMASRPRYEDAARLYQEAVDRAPDNPVPHYGLCGAQIMLGDYQAAVKSCASSIQFRPTARAYINQGVAYFDLRKYPEAAQSFEHAKALRPDYYKIAGHLARTYSWMKRTAEAKNLYSEAIRLADQELTINPGRSSVHVMLARYHAMLDQRSQAFFHLGVALKQKPTEPEYQCIAAVVHYQFGERAIAIDYLAKAFNFGYSLTEIEAERELDNLREDPQFRALIAR